MTIHPTAFDAFAQAYDNTFTNTRLGRMLRARVWTHLKADFQPGQHILEVACGTGEDAVWLAQQGIQVTATDGSADMVQCVKAKAKRQGVEAFVQTQQLSWQDIIARPKQFAQDGLYDGVLSNFGGLNTMSEWSALAQALADLVRPGGRILLVPMGPYCPWEVGWYLLHGQGKIALRRFNPDATVQIGSETIAVWYPSARRLQQAFKPWFAHRQTESLGLWLPPSYLGHFVQRWPKFFMRLHQLEQATARLSGGWGDHYMIRFQRRDISS